MLPAVQSRKFTITFAAEPAKVFRKTVASKPPETYALLAGYANDPFRVTDLRFLPAARDAEGRLNAGASYIEPDNNYIWHIIKEELLPLDKTILGYIHSHPGNITRLSSSAPGSTVGDIGAILAEMEALNDYLPWDHALMPIATGVGADRQPVVTGWVVARGNPKPFPAEMVWETETTPGTDVAVSPRPVLELLNRWQGPINQITRDRKSPMEDRSYAIDLLRRMRARDVARFEASLDPLTHLGATVTSPTPAI